MQEQKKKNQKKGASGSSKSAKPVDRKEQDDFEKKVERAIHAEKAERAEKTERAKEAKKEVQKEADKKDIKSEKRAKELSAKKKAKLRKLEAKRKARAEKIAARHEARAAKLERKKAERAAKLEAKKKKISAKSRKGRAEDNEKIRVREAKLAERQKIREAKLEAKKQKKELRLENRRRRKAKHAHLKHATPSEKKRMVAQIKAEKERKRNAKREEAKARRLEKERVKAERRAEKDEAKRMRREDRENRRAAQPIFKSRRHVAMFAAVCSVFVIFSGLLGFSTVYFRRQKDQMTQQLNNVYERAFYDLVDNMNNLSVKLSKLMISTGEDSERYLVDVIRQSDATATNLSSIPVAEDSILNTMKYVNQLGDFCSYLQKKLANGGTLSEGDIENIEKLYDINVTLYAQMTDFYARVMAGYRFTDNLSQDMIYNNPMSDAFNEIQNGSIEYPKLIYDGPFSESVINADFKGLEGLEEVSKETAQERLNGFLSSLNPADISFESVTDAKMATYNFNVNVGGENVYAQVSKLGGNLVLFNNSRALDNFDVSVEECVEKAEAYVASIGYENMKAVWSSDYNGYVYVNVVAEQDGVLIYPDMIKIKVARDNGEILGFDALTYYMNHTERKLDSPALSALKARQKISSKLDIESEKLVLIPMDGGKESLCYEFYGTYRDMLYFVFADANTGKELNVYRVIDSESGALVM